jgi:hypothetical protein
MLLIVEIVPYVAFLGAAVLMGWVGFDILRARRRKQSPQPARDSGRGLAGPPQPITDQPEVEAEAPQVTITPDDELILPNSHAVDVAHEPDACDNAEPEPDSVESSEQAELAPEADEDLDSDESVILVRRDPSVRVFDTAVAASERKAASD